MPCLHLEGVPEDLHEALQQLARRQHESVSQIAVAMLRRALLHPKARQGVLFPLSSMTPRSKSLRDGFKVDADAAVDAPRRRRASRAAESAAAVDSDAALIAGGLSNGASSGEGDIARVAATRGEG